MKRRWMTFRQTVGNWSCRIFSADNVWRAAVAGLLLLAVVAVGFSIWQWDWLRGGSESQEPNSTTLRNAGLLIAGLIAAALAIWRSRVAERQANITSQQADTAQRGLLNERYQKGAEMLGNPVLAVRLGGIYALQSLAQEYPKQYYLQIMRLLCAFVRYPILDTISERKQATFGTLTDGTVSIRQDVQSAINAIDACRWENIALECYGDDVSSWDSPNLYGADLRGANLDNVNLYLAEISRADLSGASISRANLSGAGLMHTNLSGAGLYGANLSDAVLNNANLSDAVLDNANLSDASLGDANLSGAHLRQANLSDTVLDNTNLTGVRLTLGRGSLAVNGLTQAQLDLACADPDNPPKLDGVLDAETGEQLVWHGKPCPPQ